DEARIAASLQHPNVLPVYEIDVNDRGQPYFLMKRVNGCSLGEAIGTSTPQQRSERIASFNTVVSIFIAIGNALSCAHAAGVVHQDIKPDNIMLGTYGEVLLVDWGSALRLHGGVPRLYGTPLYMSPEQARTESADARSDVYCLGATLFHALVLRCPTWSDDPEEFWRKKRAGELDLITRDERRRVPVPLLAIALKAMSARPEDRYPDVQALVQDLEHYQAGVAVTAHRDSWWEAWRRWHARNARPFWTAIGAVTVIAALAATLYGERLKEIATWGDPIVREDFEDGTWLERWVTTSGSWKVEDGRAVSQGVGDSTLTCRTELHGDIAIEYDAEMLPGSHPCDLSVMFTRSSDIGSSIELGRIEEKQRALLQVGGNEGSYCRIFDWQRRIVAFSYFKPTVGTRYRIRAELVDNRLRLLIDGRTVCEYQDLYPFTSSYVTLYAYYSGKAFDRIRISARGTPRRLPAIAIGDFCAQREDYLEAAQQYAKVASDHPGTAMGEEARYKQGLCLQRRSDPAGAESAWSHLRTGHWRGMADLLRWDRWIAEGRHEDVLQAMTALYASADDDLRTQIAVRWAEYVAPLNRAAYDSGDLAMVERYLAVHDQILGDRIVADSTAADCLHVAGRFEELIARYPRLPIQVTKALWDLGHPEKIIENYIDKPTVVRPAFWNAGRGPELAALFPEFEDPDNALYAQGRLTELIAKRPDDIGAMIMDGQIERAKELALRQEPRSGWNMRMLGILDQVPEKERQYPEYLIATGQYEQVDRLYHHHWIWAMWPRHYFGFKAYLNGDLPKALELFDPPARLEFHQYYLFPLEHAILVPLLQELAGDTTAFARAYSWGRDHPFMYEQRPWHYARFLAGEIDEPAIITMPHPVRARFDLQLLTAVVHDRAGRSGDAVMSYRAYLDIPFYQRFDNANPFIEEVIAWRIQQLSRP
ncbi:MAG: protein kinase, partial [Planctomycetes bacterium]|nr:protein kinase [Planctomycetota bacterium]